MFQATLAEANIMIGERRTFTRVPYEHAVRWAPESKTSNEGSVIDVSRGGLRLALSETLSPGCPIQLTFDDITFGRKPLVLDGEVVWARRLDDAEDIAAGVRIVHGEPKILAAASELFYAALRRLRDNPRPAFRFTHNPGDLLTDPSWAS